MNLQNQYDLEKAQREAGKSLEKIEPVVEAAVAAA